MKKSTSVISLAALLVLLILVSFRSIKPNHPVQLQPVGIPSEVAAILNFSCTPCHTSDGGLMAKAKLNITVWNKYSPDKQKEKAAAIYSEINKGSMPPKSAREKRPEIVPGKDQIAVIKKWAESFHADPQK
jgi:hypothetical protein